MSAKENIEVAYPVTKVATAWIAVGGVSLADAASIATLVASVLAALYTLLLICEWVWKKLKPRSRKRRAEDTT